MGHFFVTRPIFSTSISLLVVLAGAIACQRLAMGRYPDVIPPTIVVSSTLPGASAETIEESIAIPVEQQLHGLENILYFTSKCTNKGVYTASIVFRVGTDQTVAAMEVQNKLSIAQRQLPLEAIRQGVTVRKRQPSVLLLLSLKADANDFDYLYLSNFAKLNLYENLARVPGVGEVVVFNARDYGMRIWLDPARMAALGVSSEDVSAALEEQNAIAPGGRIGTEPAPQGQVSEYAVHVRGRLHEPSEYEQIILRAREDGSTVRLRDVGRVELGAEAYAGTSLLNNELVSPIGIYQLPNANALEVAERVRDEMARLAKTFPKGVTYSIPLDTTEFVSASLANVARALLEAACLVALVTLIFLRSWRASLIPMLAVPVSVLGTMVAYLGLGFSINTLTLSAMVLAIGLVVDDAIIVTEATAARMEQGLSSREAAIAALGDVFAPVVAIALVLCAVFVPMAFIGGLAGQFYRQFALTLAVSTLISAFVALTFTPAICGVLLRIAPPALQQVSSARRPLFSLGVIRWISAGYLKVIRWTVGRPNLMVLVLLAISAAALWLGTKVPVGFIPDEDQARLLVSVTLPPGASHQRTAEVTRNITNTLRGHPEVADVLTINGYNAISDIDSSNTATLFVPLTHWRERAKPESTAEAVQHRLEVQLREVKEANVMVLSPAPVPGVGQAGGFDFVIKDRLGGTLSELEQVAQEFIAAASGRPQLARVYTQFSSATPQFEYVVDREQAKMRGVKLPAIFATLQMLLGGRYINDFNLYGRAYRVMAQAEGLARSAPDSVNRLYVRSENKKMIPLSTLVSVHPTTGPQYIERFNGARAITVSGGAASGFSSMDAMSALEDLGAELPDGYAFEWSGTSLQEKMSGGYSLVVFGLGLIFVFIILAAQYESWSLPIAVILGTPSAFVGAFAGLATLGLTNDIYAQIGIVMLIALAAKNGVLVVEYARRRYDDGLPLHEAAAQGAVGRIRPILMTSLALIIGALPLAFAQGAGAAARRTIGATVVCGMTATTLIGAFLVPALYVFVQTLAERAGARGQMRTKIARRGSLHRIGPAPEAAGAGHAMDAE